jgi:hypothetical protein
MAITNCIRFDDDVRFALDQHAYFDFYGASSQTTGTRDTGHGTCRSTWTHYSDSEPTSFCSYSLMLRA